MLKYRRGDKIVLHGGTPMKASPTLALLFGLLPAVAVAQNTVPAAGGVITITPFQHASLQIEYGGKVIQIDPAQGDLSKARLGDLVLITDIHGDHLNPGLIGAVRKAGAPVVMPEAVKSQVGDKVAAPTEVMANGQSKTVAGVGLEAVPMYNLQRGPSAGQFFHTKGRGNGYVITLGGKRVYIAGDTECVPEIKALKDIDVAFLPMNLPYTMPPAEAADCVKAFRPKIVYPYHFQGQKPEEFANALKGSGIEVRILDWYPAAGRSGN
jgi:L-ascorbate metabolism protein UlaG (beta-lactamase superfamily)